MIKLSFCYVTLKLYRYINNLTIPCLVILTSNIPIDNRQAIVVNMIIEMLILHLINC